MDTEPYRSTVREDKELHARKGVEMIARKVRWSQKPARVKSLLHGQHFPLHTVAHNMEKPLGALRASLIHNAGNQN